MDDRLIPLYLSAISLFWLSLHYILPRSPLRSVYSRFIDIEDHREQYNEYVNTNKKETRFWQALRLGGCIALAGLGLGVPEWTDGYPPHLILNTLLYLFYVSCFTALPLLS